MGDALTLLAWRNEPTARQASFDSAEVQNADHRRWLAQRLADPGCRMWIAMMGENPIGQVRVEQHEPGKAEISFGVAPEHRGRGYATEMLHEAERQVAAEGFASELVARVKPDNAASLAALSGAGFVITHTGADAVVLSVRPSPK